MPVGNEFGTEHQDFKEKYALHMMGRLQRKKNHLKYCNHSKLRKRLLKEINELKLRVEVIGGPGWDKKIRTAMIKQTIHDNYEALNRLSET